MSKDGATLTFDLPVSLRITGGLSEVFRSWTDPALAAHWLCDRVEGEWKPGAKVYWHFGESRQEIRVVRVETEKVIEFEWNANLSQPETNVKIEFRDLGKEVGLVLTESSFALSIEAVRWALDAACGWENIFCRLKAWTESKVKLR
jgi:uncharacterized protein YndB with AHSA1/START domain